MGIWKNEVHLHADVKSILKGRLWSEAKPRKWFRFGRGPESEPTAMAIDDKQLAPEKSKAHPSETQSTVVSYLGYNPIPTLSSTLSFSSSDEPSLLCLPADIHHLIMDQISCNMDKLSYATRDTATLRSLCVVSRFYNALAIPRLYSAITVFSTRQMISLEACMRRNSRPLRYCRCFRFAPSFDDGGTVLESVIIVLDSATSLQRIYLGEASCMYLDGLTGLAEVAFPEKSFATYQLSTYSYRHLQRLAVGDIPFQQTTVVEHLLKALPRLTHLAVGSSNVQRTILGVDTAYYSGVVHYLEDCPIPPRIIFGLDVSCKQDDAEFEIFRARLLSLLHRDLHESVVWLEFGSFSGERAGSTWFADRVVDGTLWEMVR